MRMETAFTAIKSTNYDKVLELTNSYFEKFGLHLIEERVGDKKGKFTLSPKSYKNLQEYETREIKPMIGAGDKVEFTTNFDFFSNLSINPDWCVFSYPTRLAKFTLSIDSDLTEFLSKELDTTAFDYFNYSVVGQQIIRSFEKGRTEDKLYISGENEVDDAVGYFEKLEKFEDKDLLTDKEWDEKQKIISNFSKHIGFKKHTEDTSPNNKKTRRPMYLKGQPKKIVKFLKRKLATFYFP